MIKRKPFQIAAACLGFSVLICAAVTLWFRAGIVRVRTIPREELSESPYPVLFSLDKREYQPDGSCLITARAVAQDALFPFDNYTNGQSGETMLFSTRLGVLEGDKVCLFPSRAFIPELSEAPDETEERMEQALARVDWTGQYREKLASYGMSVYVPARFAGSGLPLVLVMVFPEESYLVPLEETL